MLTLDEYLMLGVAAFGLIGFAAVVLWNVGKP